MSRREIWKGARGAFMSPQWEANNMNDLDSEVERIDKGHAWDESDEVVEAQVKAPLDKVIPVRLSAEKWEELRQEAR